MTTTAVRSTTQQGVYRFTTGESIYWERETNSRVLPADLASEAPDTWLWCFDCERAFQLDEARKGDEAHCPYVDCSAAPTSFWKWDSYRAFSGARIVPAHERVFPLATAA